MFLEHSSGVRRLGSSAGSASKVMLATQANERKEAKRDSAVCKLKDKVCDLFLPPHPAVRISLCVWVTATFQFETVTLKTITTGATQCFSFPLSNQQVVF